MVDNCVLIQATDVVLKRLKSMTDEELLKELEECEPGPFSKMIEDGFTLIGMNDAYLNCIKEYIRVSELCREYNEENDTNIKPWQCVSYNGILNKFSAHPVFLTTQDLSKYGFAIDILEDRPVFPGDTLYFTKGVNLLGVVLVRNLARKNTLSINIKDYPGKLIKKYQFL